MSPSLLLLTGLLSAPFAQERGAPLPQGSAATPDASARPEHVADGPQPGVERETGTLAAVGERLGPATVDSVELHPEFQRYHLSVAGQPLPPVEMVKKPLLRQGVCVAHGLTLFPRWELSGPVPEDPWIQGERDPQTDEERTHAALCERLEQRGELVVLGLPETDAESEPPPPIDQVPTVLRGPHLPLEHFVFRWLHPPLGLAVLLGLGLGLGGLRRTDRGGRRDAALVLLVAVAARLLLTPVEPFNGALASWEKLSYAWGMSELPGLYGSGWATLMGPLHALFGRAPQVTLLANLGLSLVAPLALYAALRESAGATAARLGGLFMALLPLHLRLSGSEAMTVPTVSLSLVALAAALRSGRPVDPDQSDGFGTAAGALAGLAAGFVVHLRPEALLLLPGIAVAPFVRGGRAALARTGPWLALVLGGALLGMRLLELPPPSDDGPLRLSTLLEPGFWLGAMHPSVVDLDSPINLALDLSWTSPLLWLGAGLALWKDLRKSLPWILWHLGGLVLLAKSWPLADAMRLQLVTAPGLVALGALGLGPLLAHRRAAWQAGAALLVALPALLWPFTGPRLDLARHHEARWLIDTVPQLEPGSIVLYDDEPVRGEDLAVIMLAMNPSLQAYPASQAPLSRGMLLYRGLSCIEQVRSGSGRPGETDERPGGACTRVEEACSLVPAEVTRVPARTDLDAALPEELIGEDGMVEVGFYRLQGCEQ